MEVLLSVFVLEIGLVATVSLMASSISHSADSRNQIIAAQLTQEGIELINNIRDNNWASGKTAFDPPFPANSLACTVNYDYDYTTGSGINCSSPDLKLYYKDSFYVHDSSGSVATRFQRKITIADDSDGNKRITSMVIWGNSTFPAIGSCNTGAKCTYSEMVLSSTNYH